MLNNIQEFYNILPFIIVGAGIVIALLIELYSGKAKTILPWFAIATLLASGFYALITVKDILFIE